MRKGYQGKRDVVGAFILDVENRDVSKQAVVFVPSEKNSHSLRENGSFELNVADNCNYERYWRQI